MEIIRNFDYVGTILFTGGMVVFLLGISWGGNQYPWKSAAVIASIIIGILTLAAFFIWELFAPLKEPLVRMHLFKNRDWVITVLLLSIGASVYYGFSIVWPSMVVVVYSDGNAQRDGWLECCVRGAFTLGQIVGGFLCNLIGRSRIQIIIIITAGGALLGGISFFS